MSSIRKKEGFQGQRAIVLPKKVIAMQCDSNNIIYDSYITDIGYYPNAVNHYRKRSNGIDQNILIYCVEGKGWVEIEGARHQVVAGNFFVVPAGTPHIYGSANNAPWTIYWLHIRGQKADTMCASIINKHKGYKGLVKYSEPRIALFDEMYSTLERGYGSEHVLYANLCLSHFLASFLLDENFGYLKSVQSHDPATAAIDYMQNNLGNTLTLKNVASHVNLSVSHFVALFHRRTGFAPIEYFNHLKIQQACQYLQFTDESIASISSTLGIEDPYYFSRLFKKLMGRSPLHYRKIFRSEK